MNLTTEATFWWKVADANGNVVRTYINGVTSGPGNLTWQWDGRDNNGAFVPDGTYYSVMTASTSAGSYYHSLPVDVRAFRVTPALAGPYVRGTKVKFFVASAEPLMAKPKVKVLLSGLALKTYRAYNVAGGGYYVTIVFPATAQAGTFTVTVVGTDTGSAVQQTNYSYQLQ